MQCTCVIIGVGEKVAVTGNCFVREYHDTCHIIERPHIITCEDHMHACMYHKGGMMCIMGDGCHV